MGLRWFVVAAIALALAAGCVSGGGLFAPDTPEPSLLSRLFPNEDGNSWSFDLVAFVPGEFVAVPEAITRHADEIYFAEVEAFLVGALPPPSESGLQYSGTLELRFDGRIGTLSGSKQYLRDTLIVETGAIARGASAGGRAFALTKAPDSALAPLATPPLGWGFSAFEKKEKWIGFYSTAREDSAFTLLQEPIEPGAFFRHQINPQVSDAMWEYGWIAGPRLIELSNRFVIEDAIAVVYVIDWGEARSFDDPTPFRPYSASITYFAPDVGPVYQRSIEFLGRPVNSGLPEMREAFVNEATLRDYSVRAAR